MKKSYSFLSAFALIASLTLLSFKPYAQSTNTSSKKNDTTAAVGLTEIQQYVQNSRAVLDSLLRYQDAKINLQLKNRLLSSLQIQLTDCHIQNTKLRSDANEMAVRLFDANEAYHQKRKKLRTANFEKWAWRVLTVAGTYLYLKQL